jgi:hypothetical protein
LDVDDGWRSTDEDESDEMLRRRIKDEYMDRRVGDYPPFEDLMARDMATLRIDREMIRE